jgi:hypothetical protein
MSQVALVLFWLPSAVVAWVYAGYPACAAIAGRVRPFRLRPAAPRPPRHGRDRGPSGGRPIAPRIADILAQEVPFELEVVVASDGSTDDTVRIADALAALDPRIVVLDLDRGGQTAAQNAIFGVATGDVVVLSDAETRFAPGCLAALVAPFADPRVGCTTGRLAWLDARRTETSRNEGAYWRYSSLSGGRRGGGLAHRRDRALLAVRRSSFRRCRRTRRWITCCRFMSGPRAMWSSLSPRPSQAIGGSPACGTSSGTARGPRPAASARTCPSSAR